MLQIPLQILPNQTLSVQLDGNNYDITITSNNPNPLSIATAFMTFTIIENGVVLVQNVRAVPAFPVIGYSYLAFGNFFIITDNDDYPDYLQFGVTQFLIFASQAELEVL